MEYNSHLQSSSLAFLPTIPPMQAPGTTYPVMKVTELASLFQKQHGTGYWEIEGVALVHLNVAMVTQVLEKAGAKSLGMYTCM